MLDPRSGDGADDLLGYRARHLSFTFTNRCNLRCVYCPQGTHPDEFHADSPDEQLRKIVAYIEQHGIERVSLGYYGETMMIAAWVASPPSNTIDRCTSSRPARLVWSDTQAATRSAQKGRRSSR